MWTEAGASPTDEVPAPRSGSVLVLAPHPDDPESAAITCRLLARSGLTIHFTICCLSPAGVQDEYALSQPTDVEESLNTVKAQIRRREQQRSAALFGLPEERLTFLLIGDDRELDTPENRARVQDHIGALSPDIVILPSGADTNRTHRWVCEVFRRTAADLVSQDDRSICGFYIEDPKTTQIRPDLVVLFDEKAADWKRELLRCHDSQQQRNLRERGSGFDQRILSVNRARRQGLADSLSQDRPAADYAECFELELFGR